VRNELLAWQAKPFSIGPREDVDLVALGEELLVQLADVARQPAFDSRIAEGGIVQVRPAQPGT